MNSFRRSRPLLGILRRSRWIIWIQFMTFLGWSLSAPQLNAVYVPAEGYALNDPASWAEPSWQSDTGEPEPAGGPDQEDTDGEGGDGLPNWFEDWYEFMHAPAGWTMGTMRGNPDSDFDGATDGDELLVMSSDPLDAYSLGMQLPDGSSVTDGQYYQWANQDSDGDGLNDWPEMTEHGTNANAYDTDGDGWGDGDEIAAGSLATNPDSDGDGLGDLDDSIYSNDPYGDHDADGLDNHTEATTSHSLPDGTAGYTSLRVADTDGDGLSDGYEAATQRYDEYKLASNPLRVQTDANTNDGQNSTYLFPSDLPQSLSITTSGELPAAYAGMNYATTFSAANASGSVSWNVTDGELPAGFGFEGASLVGNASTPGVFHFTVTAQDAHTSVSAFFTLVVSVPAVWISSSSQLAGVYVGNDVSHQFAASGGGGGYVWSCVNLPVGLSLSSEGLLTGILYSTENYYFTVSVSAADGSTAEQTACLSVTEEPPPPVVEVTSSPNLTDGWPGQSYSWSFSAAGGTGTYSWTAGALPAGLSLDPSGYLSGTSSESGTHTFSVTATDGNGISGGQTCTLTIGSIDPPAIEILDPGPMTSSIWSPFDFHLSTSASDGTSLAWSFVDSPEGVSIDPVSGVISGSLGGPGSSITFTVTVTDGYSSGSLALSITGVDQDSDGDGLDASLEHELAVATGLPLHDSHPRSNAGNGAWDDIPGPSDWMIYYHTSLNGAPSPQSEDVANDADGDNLGPILEGWLHTNPDSADSNEDHRPDWWEYYQEYLQFTEPLDENGSILDADGDGLGQVLEALLGTSDVADTGADSDHDGLSDAWEWNYIYYSDPALPDTDADGLPDGLEYQHSTYARFQDSDGDHLTDAEEINGAFGPGLNLSPTNPDTDGDGFPDWTEVDLTDSDGAGIPDRLEEFWLMDKDDPLDEQNDLDGDGQTNLEAYQRGWDVRASFVPLFDRDGDRMTNNYELARGLDPDDKTDGADDPDGDWLTNAEEFRNFSHHLQNPTVSLFNTPEGMSAQIWSIDQETGEMNLWPRSPWNDYEFYSGSELWLTPICADGERRDLQRDDGPLANRQYEDDWDQDGVTNYDELYPVSGTPSDPRYWDEPLVPTHPPQPVIGQPYDTLLMAMGGQAPYQFTLSPGSSLPGWLTQTGNRLHGTAPSTPGQQTPFTLQVTDARGISRTLDVHFTVESAQPLLPMHPPQPGLGKAYDTLLSAIGGVPPYQFSLEAGSILPGWLTQTGNRLHGTAPSTPGQEPPFTMRVTDAQGTSQTMVVTLEVPMFEWTKDADLGVVEASEGSYSVTLSTAGGNGAVSFAATGPASSWTLLPSGEASISFPSDAAGFFSFTATATDESTPPQILAARTFTLRVRHDPTLTLNTTPAQLIGTVGESYSVTLSATSSDGEPCAIEVTSDLPSGLHYDSSTRSITGIPSTPESTAVAFAVTSTSAFEETVTAVFTRAISVAMPLSIDSVSPLPAAMRGQLYSEPISASGGNGALTLSLHAGGLPAGITLSPSGRLVGTPQVGGTFDFTLKATDTDGRTALQPFSLVVYAPPPVPPPDPVPTEGVTISGGPLAFSASGGSGQYAWNLVWEDGAGIFTASASFTAAGNTATISVANPNPEPGQQVEWEYKNATITVVDEETYLSATMDVSVNLWRIDGTAPPDPTDPAPPSEDDPNPVPQPDPEDPVVFRVTGSDGTGPRYRKVGLNGIPLPDGKPQSKDESGELPEETYIDAFSAELRHGVSDVYSSVDSSNLPLLVRRDTLDDVWEENTLGLSQGHILPHQRQDRPFGMGWSSNLCATVVVGPGGRHATVTDEQGASQTFFRFDTPGIVGHSWQPSHDVKLGTESYWNQLHSTGVIDSNGRPSPGMTFTFTKQFGTTCHYQYCMSQASGFGQQMSLTHYFRLVYATDRMGNRFTYSYPNSTRLIPNRISDPDRPDVWVNIQQDTAKPLVTRVVSSGGQVTDYSYTHQGWGPSTVSQLTSVNRRGSGNASLGMVQYRYNLHAEPNRYRHAAVDQITDERGNPYTFTYAINDMVKYVVVVNNAQSIHTQIGLPRLVSQVLLPGDHGTTTFTRYRDALIRAGMSPAAYSVTSVAGPAGNTTYHFTNPRLYIPPAEPGREMEAGDRHASLSFTRMQIFPGLNSGGMVPQPSLPHETYLFDYNSSMALASATDLSGNTTSFSYSGGYNDPVTETNALDAARHFTYDTTTRVMDSMTDENGVRTLYTLQPGTSIKLKEEVFSPSGTLLRRTRFDHDDPRFPSFVTRQTLEVSLDSQAADHCPALVTEFQADSNGRLWKQVVDPAGQAAITYTSYDGAGRKRFVADPRGHITEFRYDAVGRLTETLFPGGASKSLGYDLHGNLTRETNENGVSTFHAYDELNRRVKSAIDLNGNGIPDWDTALFGPGDHSYTAAGSTPGTATTPPSYDGDIVTTTTYNARNQVLSTTDARGSVTKHEYDNLGRITETTVNATAPAEKRLVTTFHYDGNNGGSLFDSSVVKPNRVIDPQGVITEVEYNDLYLPVSSTITAPAALGGFTEETLTEYDAARRPISVTDPLGRVTLTQYDDFGQVVRVTEPDLTPDTSDNPTVQTFYTSHGKPWKVIDQMGRATTTSYDASGRPQSVTSPAVNGVSAVTHTTYDPAGNAISVRDPLNRVIETEYDARNRPWRVTAPFVTDATTQQLVRPVTTTSYDDLGQVISVTDPMGAVTTTHYDRAGRKWKVEAPAPSGSAPYAPGSRPTTLTTFDPGGLPLTVTNPIGQTITNTYNALGQLVSTLDAESILNEFQYDRAGNRTLVKDGLHQETTFTYDGLKRLVEQTFANGDTWTYQYHSVQKVGQLSPRGIYTRYSYDTRDRLLAVDAWDTGGFMPPFDDPVPETGLLIHRAYTYDNTGRLVTVSETPSPISNLPTSALAVSYTYDEMGRVTAESSHGQTHQYQYDLVGNRTRAQYSTGRIIVTGYDALNRPRTIEEQGTPSRLTHYGYDLAGRALKLTSANGQTSLNGYDALGRLTDRTSFKTPAMQESQVLVQFEWEHDLLGNVLAQHETWPGDLTRPQHVRSTIMAYDHNNRLVTETIQTRANSTATPQDQSETSYTYDDANNRATKTVTRISGTTSAEAGENDIGHWIYDYNEANQLVAWEKWDAPAGTLQKSATLTYDDAGNRTSQTIQEQGTPNQEPRTTAYTWDAQDRLASVTLPSQPGTENSEPRTFTYAYDYRTRRVGTVEQTLLSAAEKRTSITFSGGLSVAEYESTVPVNSPPSALSSTPTVEYTRGPDMGGGVGGLLYTSRRDTSSPSLPVSSSPSLRYNLSNGRGDIVAQSDSYASLTWTASYEAYGKRTKETGENKDKQRGNSKDEDPTGLLNEGFRYRDIETGVWLSRDPAGFVDGPNLYAYVRQNPWTCWDPDGLASATRMWDHLIRGEFKEAAKEAPLLGPSTSFNDIKGLVNLPKAITETAKKTAVIADKRGGGAATGHVLGELTGANRFAEGVLGTEINVDNKGNLVENKLSTRESIVRTIEGAENILATALTFGRAGAPKTAPGAKTPASFFQSTRLEVEALQAQGLSRGEAFAQMRSFNAGNADGYVFHFTTPQGGRGILNDGFIKPSASGVAGPGVYTGITPTPSWFTKNVPFAGWGLGGKGSNVRIPIQTAQPSMTPWLPPQTRVFRDPLPIGGSN